MATCFVYGTLLAEEVLARVLFGRLTLEGTPISRQEAVLKGYKRYKLKDRDYPGIVAGNPDDKVIGRLVFNVDEAGLQRLDDFEGTEYKRVTVDVTAADGSVHQANTYLFLDTDLLNPDAGEWYLDDFQKFKMKNWIADELGATEGLGGRFWNTTQPTATAQE